MQKEFEIQLDTEKKKRKIRTNYSRKTNKKQKPTISIYHLCFDICVYSNILLFKMVVFKWLCNNSIVSWLYATVCGCGFRPLGRKYFGKSAIFKTNF